VRISTRASALVIALTAAAGLAVPLAAPASALLPSTVTCAKVNSGVVKSGGAAASTFATCTPAALKLGGTGSTTKTPPAGSSTGSVGFKITWKGGKGTTTAAIKFAPQKTLGKCPTTGGYKRLAVAGSVKVATGAAAKITKVGQAVTASQCVVVSGAKAGTSMLEPGTKFKL
jgi:hypothetical protein